MKKLSQPRLMTCKTGFELNHLTTDNNRMKMNIEQIIKILELTKGSQESESSSVYPWEIGEKYFIRTVTMHLVGKLIAVTDKELVLENASWIADSGRFHDALKSGKFDEVEPFINDVIVNQTSVIDATIFDHELPQCQK